MIAVAEEAGQSVLGGLTLDRIAADSTITWPPDTGLDATHPSAATSPSSSFTAPPQDHPHSARRHRRCRLAPRTRLTPAAWRASITELPRHARRIRRTHAGALLLVIGINWVGALRGCLRAVWEKEQDPGNPILLRLKDTGVLVGLGVVGVVGMGSSVFANSAVGWAADKVGIEGGAGRRLRFFATWAIALLVDFLLLVYLVTRLPQVHPGRRAVVIAGLIGAVGFELLKLLLTSYLQGIAGKSMYGAFAVPVAVVLWINLMASLLLYCAAWTATAVQSSGTTVGEGPDSGVRPAVGDAPQGAAADGGQHRAARRLRHAARDAERGKGGVRAARPWTRTRWSQQRPP